MATARFALPLCLALAALAALPVAAQDAARHCTVKELAAQPLPGKGLTVTIKELNGYRVMASNRRYSGRGRFLVAVENPGAGFALFNPQDLAFVGKDGAQVFPFCQLNLADDTLPQPLRIAPGAHVSVEYVLSGGLAFPAKVYWGDSLVAVVTE